MALDPPPGGIIPSAAADRQQLLGELRLRVYEGLKAHSASAGIPLVGGVFEQTVIERATSQLAGLPASQISSLTLASDRLVSAVASGFDTVISQLSGPQQLALRAGLDPFSPAVIQAINSPGGLTRLLSGVLADRSEQTAAAGQSGRRFSDLRSDDMRDGQSSDAASLLKATGLSRDAYADLVQKGYTMAQIRQAARFADDLGVDANAYAGKFAGLDKKSKSDLSAFVDRMRADPSLTDEEKKKDIAEFRAAHPKLKTLSDADILNIVNAKQTELRNDVGADGARQSTKEQVTASPTATQAAAAARAIADVQAAKRTTNVAAADVRDAFGVSAKPPSAARKSWAPT